MSAGGRQAWRGTLALWAAAIAVCAAAGGATWAVEASARRAVAERRSQRALSNELFTHVAALHDQTLEQVEAKLNGGRLLPRVPGPDDSRRRVVVAGEALDPRYKGWRVRLAFFKFRVLPPDAPASAEWPEELKGVSQGTVTGGDGLWSPYYLYSYSATPPPAHAGPSAWTVVQVARLRWALLVFGAAGFVIALFTLPFAGRWRRQVAQVMLACVLVAAAGWAVEPGRSWSPAAMSAPVPLALAFGALVGVCALVPHVREVSQGRCEACGYDLTGNASGTCPECGTATPRGRVERWSGIAERIEHVDESGAAPEVPLEVCDEGDQVEVAEVVGEVPPAERA